MASSWSVSDADGTMMSRHLNEGQEDPGVFINIPADPLHGLREGQSVRLSLPVIRHLVGALDLFEPGWREG